MRLALLVCAGILTVGAHTGGEKEPGVSSAATAAASESSSSHPLHRLRVTQGRLRLVEGELLEIDAPKVRAVGKSAGARAAELAFTYLGPTATTSRLASGAERRQLGLKLRARDGCNVVYAMWRIAPKQELVVSVKSNPDQTTSAACGNRGYRNVRPLVSKPLPKLEPGDSHQLRAELDGSKLRVLVDGASVWEGDLGEEALAFDGPAGLRTDNARVRFSFSDR